MEGGGKVQLLEIGFGVEVALLGEVTAVSGAVLIDPVQGVKVVFAVIGTNTGVLKCVEVGGQGGAGSRVVSEVRVGDKAIRSVDVAEVSAGRKVAVVCTEAQKVALFELPGLGRINLVSFLSDELLDGSQAIAVRELQSEEDGRSGFRIAAAVGKNLRVVDVDADMESAVLLGDLELGFVAQLVRFGGANGRTICASIWDRHALVRASSTSVSGKTFALAAEISAASEQSSRRARGLSKTSVPSSHDKAVGDEDDDEGTPSGVNPLLAALSLGLVGGGNRSDRQAYGQQSSSKSRGGEPLALPLSGERWLLRVGSSGVRLYSSFGAMIARARDVGFGKISAGVSCLRGSVVLLSDAIKAGQKSDGSIRALTSEGARALDLEPIQIPAAIRSAKETSKSRAILYPTLDGKETGDVVAAVGWEGSRWVGLVVQKMALSEAVGLLEKDSGKIEHALVLSINVDDTNKVRELQDRLAREKLDAGEHSKALAYLSSAGHGLHELLNMRSELASVSWRDAENVVAWADALNRARRRGAAASEPDQTDDEALLEALCSADATTDRIRSLFRSRHAITTEYGEKLIFSGQAAPKVGSTEQRELAFADLLRSNQEHSRALDLIENSHFVHRRWEKALDYLRDVNDEPIVRTHLQHYLESTGPGEIRDAVEALNDNVLPSAVKLGVANEQMAPFAIAYAEDVLNSQMAAPAKDTARVGTEVRSSDELQPINEDRRLAQNVLADAIQRELATLEAIQNDGAHQPHSAMEDASLESDQTGKGGTVKDAKLALRRQAALERLQRMLDSHVEDPTFVLEKLPSELWEKRVEMLGNLGRHDEAMRILATEGGDAEVAERYCMSHQREKRGEVMTSLIRAYLEQSSRRPEFVARAAGLLASQSFGQVDLIEAMRGASDDCKIETLHSFLLAAVSAATARARQSRAQRALLKSEMLVRKDELLKDRGESILVSPEASCRVCRRRIGDSVFAAYSDGSFVHYACHRSASSNV